MYSCTYGCHCRLRTMWRDSEGDVYWDELAETCGEILMAAGFGCHTFKITSVQPFLIKCMLLVKLNFLVATGYKYSGTSDNRLPLLQKPPKCGQEPVVPNHSL